MARHPCSQIRGDSSLSSHLLASLFRVYLLHFFSHARRKEGGWEVEEGRSHADTAPSEDRCARELGTLCNLSVCTTTPTAFFCCLDPEASCHLFFLSYITFLYEVLPLIFFCLLGYPHTTTTPLSWRLIGRTKMGGKRASGRNWHRAEEIGIERRFWQIDEALTSLRASYLSSCCRFDMDRAS